MKFNYKIEIYVTSKALFVGSDIQVEQGVIDNDYQHFDAEKGRWLTNCQNLPDLVKSIINKHTDLLDPAMKNLCESTTTIDTFRINEYEWGGLARSSTVQGGIQAVVILQEKGK